jgi:nitrogen-specific signal transduction histidine kinase/DNA-binding response OmpR family regulator
MNKSIANASSPQPLKVLLVEDNPADAELCIRELKKAGFDPHADVVQTAPEFAARLAEGSYHVVLGDYTLPAWSGLEALELLQRLGRDTPFILCTGTLREEEAAQCLRHGVAGYVHKDRLEGIGPSVRTALERKSADGCVVPRRGAQVASRQQGELPEEKPAGGVAGNATSLAAFVELNPNPVLAFSSEGQLGYFNQAAREMAQSLGKEHPSAMLPPDWSAIIKTCLATGQKKLRVETTMGGRTFSWSFCPIKKTGVVHCYVGDITERRQLEDQLRHSQKLESVGRLAAGVAHDFNNILTVIQGHTGLLRADAALTPAMSESVQGIARAAERGGKLTSQLLAFSRRNVLQPRRLDLNEVLTNLSSLLHRTLGEDINYQFDYASELPALHADPGLLEQVVMNLAVNARDAMPRGGQLVISTALADIDAGCVARHPGEARAGRFVCLTITDTGCGMDHVTMSRIFEPFFTTKEFGKGTGLGLAMVYGIVKQHQGWVEVQSRVGQGTTFKIFLPPDQRDPGSQREAVPGEESLRGTETLLVVEDEPPVRWIVKDVLGKYGYNVLEAGNGVEALALWHQHHGEIALLLTDVVMPVGLTGQELAEKFSAHKPGLKIIFISGYSLQVAGKGFSEADGLNFLQKPFDGAKLAWAVRRCLDS